MKRFRFKTLIASVAAVMIAGTIPVIALDLEANLFGIPPISS